MSGTETHSRSITSRTGKGKHESYCWKTRVIGSEKKPRGAQRSSLPPGSQRHCRQHAQTCPPQTDGSGRSPHLGPEQARSWGFDALPRSPPNPSHHLFAAVRPGPFPRATESPTTSHAERVHGLRKSPFEDACERHTPSPPGSDGVVDSCARHGGPPTPGPTPALPASVLSSRAPGFCRSGAPHCVSDLFSTTFSRC